MVVGGRPVRRARGQGMTVVECSGWRCARGNRRPMEEAKGRKGERRRIRRKREEGGREDRACDRDGHMAPESQNGNVLCHSPLGEIV